MLRRGASGVRRVAALTIAALAMAACSSDGDSAPDGDASPDGGACGPFPPSALDVPEDSAGEFPIDLRDEWGDVFDEYGVAGTFVLRQVGDPITAVWDPARAGTPRLPASTFKILNSMVILQTGLVDDVDETLEWDGTVREVDAWNQDHSLRSGIEVSAVWAYQAWAQDVGEETMSDWVERADYGNGDIGGGIDQFWLNGDLRISPFGQLDVLEDMVTGRLPFDAEVVDQVCEILVREEGDGWRWSHKTGTALAEQPVLGWLVGTAQNDGSTWVFAMNLDLTSPGALDGQIDPQVRQTITRAILEAEDALPPS